MSKPHDKKIQIKIGKIKLTDHEKMVIATNLDSEFFKIITTKIIPKRLVQVGQTSLALGQTGEDLWFYKGKYSEVDWLVKTLRAQSGDLDPDEGDPDEGELKSKSTS